MGRFETFVEIDRPPAGNVIGNLDVSNLAALEVLGDNIISVDKAIVRLAWLSVHWGSTIPFTTLQVTDSGRKNEAVTRTHSLDDTSCEVVLPTPYVCLVDGMKFTTATRDLKPSLGRLPLDWNVTCLLVM